MLNPYLWLGFVVMLALSGFTGYRQGVKVTKADYEQAAQVAMTAMITRHNELADADIKAAVKAEQQRQSRRVKDLEVRHELELEAVRNHRPECDWSEREHGLLNDLVDRANGKADAAPGVPDGMRQPAAPLGADGQGREGVGWWGRIKLWGMQKPSRGVRGLGETR